MNVIKNENVVYFDVDQTLIDWYGKLGKISFNHYGEKIVATPIKENIRFLKTQKARGNYIVVHTGNGYQWAEEVINKLKLSKYVDLIMTKPSKYVDDKEFHTFAKRIHLGEK